MELKTFTNAEGINLLLNTRQDEDILAKGLSFDDKVEYLRFLLLNDTVFNVSMLANLTMLIKGSNLNESDFADERVVFKDLEEYIDIKQELLPEIKDYRNQLAKYFLGALKSVCVVLPDGKIEIPAAYRAILSTFTLMDLSKVIRNADSNIADAPLVFYPEAVLTPLNAIDPALEQICSMIIKNLGE